MKKAIYVLWAVTGLMFLILCGCGGGDGSDSSSGSVNVANNSYSGLAVARVQISPSSSSTWGPNQLGTNQLILSGSSLTFSNIAPGSYGMLVTLEDGQSLQWDNLEVYDGETTNTQISSAYKAVAKTTVNPDATASNFTFTYVPANGNEGATKEPLDKVLKVSDQYVTEIVK